MFHIPPDVFYGLESPSTKTHVETPRRKLDTRIDLKHRQTPLLSTSRTWKIFERQDEALEFASRHAGNGLMTFVFHTISTGQRMFLVAHPREYWVHHLRQSEQDRCGYEVIPEYVQCKLYFDLEFEYQFNPGCDGVAMTELLINIVSYHLKQLYHLEIGRNLILDLDSSTDTKFSRHLIYQIPFLCFANNYQVGLFVREICDMICTQDVPHMCETLSVTSVDLRRLIVKDRHGKEKVFCDLSVYSKNRHFRMYGCTKPKRNSFLRLSDENKFNIHISNLKLQQEVLFLTSLVTNFEPVDLDVVSLPERPLPTLYPKAKYNSAQETFIKGLPSPYPIVDKFVIAEMTYEGVRSCRYYPTTKRLVYEGYNPSFCANVGRIHKSNKGMLVVDLHLQHFYRKCFDPDCKHYQSPPLLLPKPVAASLQFPECNDELTCNEVAGVLEFLETQTSEELDLDSVWTSSSSFDTCINEISTECEQLNLTPQQTVGISEMMSMQDL